MLDGSNDALDVRGDPLRNLGKRGSWGEHFCDASLLEFGNVALGDYATRKHGDVGGIVGGQQLNHSRK